MVCRPSDDERVDWETVPARVGAIGSLLLAAIFGGGLLHTGSTSAG
jgi:hypothetical protein